MLKPLLLALATARHLDTLEDRDNQFDGRCVACIAARRIFCMDNQDTATGGPSNQQEGSCQPMPDYCSFGGQYNWE